MAETALEVGRIVKPHGLRGEVIVELTTNRSERVSAGTELLTESGPLRIEASTPHQGRWIVSFSGVRTREGADALRGTVLKALPIEDDDELWVHELIGMRVVDQDGVDRGTVSSVEANPASDLLVLDTGALVPSRFVVTVADVINVSVPDGLFDINES